MLFRWCIAFFLICDLSTSIFSPVSNNSIMYLRVTLPITRASMPFLAGRSIIVTTAPSSNFTFGLYGGADAKALIVLAVVLPYFQPRVGLYAIAPVIILTNGILLSMFLPGGLFLLNVTRLVRSQPIFEGFREPAYRKILACLLGYKSAGKPRGFQFSMERNVVQEQSNPSLSNSLTKKFDFTFMQDEFETKPGTWVTPGIPLLVFFAAGFIALLAYGDLVIGLVQFLAGML